MVDLNNLKFGKVSKIGNIDFKSQDFNNISKFESISPPSVFVGSQLKYPLVNVGVLSPIGNEEHAKVYDDYKLWAKNNFSIGDVLKLRSGLLNSRFKTTVTDSRLNKKFVDIAKDVAISIKPVDVEIELKNKINTDSRKDKVLTPIGLGAEMKDAKITSNISVEKVVDKVINDDIKATQGINLLYSQGINEYNVQKILSVGALGMKKDSKFVPTRWSITATDDIISKELIEKVKGYSELVDFELFHGEFLGNQYLILLFPGKFCFELFELYSPGSSWNSTKEFKASHDYESFSGRTNYAENCAGGYYATRLPIVEYLNSIRKQASVVVVRLETPSYWAALGVWVVRESVRKAIFKGAMKFSDKDEFLDGAKKIGKIKYDFDISPIFLKSWYLNYYSKQKKIDDWF